MQQASREDELLGCRRRAAWVLDSQTALQLRDGAQRIDDDRVHDAGGRWVLDDELRDDHLSSGLSFFLSLAYDTKKRKRW